MAQLTMYPGKTGSPKTTTTADITGSDTQLFLTELSVLPAAPNILVMYTSPIIWEICKYTLKQSASGAGYVTIVRSGTEWASSTGSAQSWGSGAKVSRNFFAYDYAALKNNAEDHETRLGTAESSITTIDGRIIDHETRLGTAESSITTIDGRIIDCESRMDPVVASLIFG